MDRLQREERTLTIMVGMYCRGHHAEMREGLCDDCASLLAYAKARLGRCPYGVAKPTCARCRTHCYAPRQRERIREVMRYAGPRMLRQHPLLAIRHLIDERLKTIPPTGAARD